jgi:hypothetical protein
MLVKINSIIMENLNLVMLSSEELTSIQGGECLYGDIMTAWDDFKSGFTQGFETARYDNPF